MQVLNRASDGLKRDYTVLVSPEEIEEAFVNKLKEKAATVRMDGFRPGKVPLDIVKRLQGDQIRREAVQELLKSVSQGIVKEEGVLISFDFYTSILKEDENGIEYSLKFETIPTVDVTPVSAIELTKYVAEITEDDIKEVFDNMREHHKKWVEQPEDTVAGDGDRVSVALAAKIKVKRNEENISTDMEITIGDPNIMEEFWKPLVGKKAGETVEFSVTYSKHIDNKKLAGKTIEYTADVKKISKATEYELDDEFAKSFGQEDFSKLHEWAENRVKANYEEMSEGVLRRNLLEKISEMYDFDVPDNMFQIEYADVRRQLSAEAERLGKPMSEEVEKGCKDIAYSRVRLGFVVAEVSKQNKMTVSREEVAAGIRSLAALYPGHEKAIWDMYSHGAALNAIVGPILERKVVDYLFKNIKITEQKCTTKELIDMDEETFDFFKDNSEVSVEKLQDIQAAEESSSSEGESEGKAEESAADVEEQPAEKKKRASTKKKASEE